MEPSPVARLLTPSLSKTEVQPIYSFRTLFFTAFFAGGASALVLHHFNSRRLQRVREDLPVQLVMLVGWVAMVVLMVLVRLGKLPAPAELLEGGRGTRTLVRVGALLLAGVAFLRHRRFYRAAELAGGQPANGWVGALTAMAIGVPFDLGLAWLMTDQLA